MKKIILIILVIIVLGFGAWFVARGVSFYQAQSVEREKEESLNKEINQFLEFRQSEAEKKEPDDPFGDDSVVRILFIGLDRRTGDIKGHCDAIQFINIDKKKQEVTLTAVPRGTYSPLPPGGKYLPSDYYVSKSCEVGGLEYGITQIEKILGQKADYIVVVGFSEALGIFRYFGLPTTETLQWLRQRQGYAIGEPQRAHNHSMFIKQMMVRFLPEENSSMNTALEYIIYKMIKTDLSFAEAQALVDALSAIDLPNHAERVHLLMKPAYMVRDIPYDEKNLDEYIDSMIRPIKNLLPGADFSGITQEEAQAKLLEIIHESMDDPDFSLWAFENNIWLQIEDKDKRLAVQYDVLEMYVSTLSEKSERENIISDYILEMEYYEEGQWVEKGKELLAKEMGQ